MSLHRENARDALQKGQADKAQVEALLDIADQLRIQNIIALHQHEVKYDIGEWSRLYERGGKLKSELREALDLPD